jgi:hypothetical protein
MKPPVISKPAAPGNYEQGRKAPISRITFHHIVGDAPAAIVRFQTPGVEVSSNYVIGSDGTIYQCVADTDTPYCDGNYDSNSRTIAIEHAGGIAGTPYTELMYQASIKLVRYLIGKYNIADFQRHRDVIDKTRYPGGTACPGALNVERIVKEAKENEMVDDATARAMLTATTLLAQNGDTPDRQPTKEEVENLIGRTPLDALKQVMTYEPWKHNLAKVKYYDHDVNNSGGGSFTVLGPGKYEVRV